MSEKTDAKKLFWIYENYNKDTYEKLNSIEYLDLKPFKELDSAFEEIKNLGPETIFIFIHRSLYQDYYFKIKDLKSTLQCKPITFIFSDLPDKKIDEEGVLKKETIASIGDDFYNKGGVVADVDELIQRIKKYLGNLFEFEVINDDENIIIPCLYSKVQSRDYLINNSEVNEFSLRLIVLHGKRKTSELLEDHLNKKLINIESQTKLWIKQFSNEINEGSFYYAINKEFSENNFSHYKTFTKALYRGLEKKYFKGKFDIPLYFCRYLAKDDLENLENNINNSKKELFYSKQFLSFSKDMNVSCKFLPKDADKNSIPILFEVNISNSKDAYSNNVDIEEFALYPQEKEVTFLPYSCFVIEEKFEDFEKDGIKYKKIKLNYLGNYSKQINEKIKDLNKEKIKSLLESDSNFSENIKKKFKNEFKDLVQSDLIKLLDIESKLINEKMAHKEDYQFPKNVIELTMKKKGKFLGDKFFNNYHWMLKIYFDDVLQEEKTNEINEQFPPKIKVEIDFPIFDCERMFYLCDNIAEINFIRFDTSKVTNMSSMFSDCDSLIKVNVDKFDMSNVTNMSCMFYKCSSLQKLDLSNFKTDNVTDMSAMFLLCYSLEDLNFDFSKLNIGKLEYITSIFRCCYSLNNYDFSDFDLSKIKKENREGYI